jgi:hypothetical protein
VVFTGSGRSDGMDTAGVDVRGVDIDAAGVCTVIGVGIAGSKTWCADRAVASFGTADVARGLGADAEGAREMSRGVAGC